MAKIKKACKGALYPKSSSVSSRLGSVKKAKLGTTTTETTKPMSAKDSMNMWANRYDSLSAEAAKKLGSGKDASKDIKGANKARAKEKSIAKRLYGTTPSDKKGGIIKKAKKGMKVKKYQNAPAPIKKGMILPTWDEIKDKASKVKSLSETYKPLIDKIKSVKLTPKKLTPKNKMGGKTKKCAYGCK